MVERQSDYEFIDYRPEFKDQALQLLSEMWGDDMELKDRYFDWKFLKNPYADKMWGKLALHDGQVVGVRNMFPMCWHIGPLKRDIFTLGCSDAFVHPDHRRRGLLNTMTLMILEDMVDSPYKYSTTLYPVVASNAAYQKLGWKSVGLRETGLRLRPNRAVPQSKFRSIAGNIPYLRPTYRKLRSMLSSSSESTGGALTEKVQTFSVFDTNTAVNNPIGANISISQAPDADVMADLIKEIGNESLIQHVRDRKYFSWRYQNPRATYRFLYAGSEKLSGYMVLQCKVHATNGIVNVVDWVAKDLHTCELLLQTAIDLGDFMAITVWSETLPEGIKHLLKDNGFHFEMTDDSQIRLPRLLFRPVLPESVDADWEIDGLNMLDLRNWNLQAIDADGS
jgi:GNAT superfamily N-acetyltransferase